MSDQNVERIAVIGDIHGCSRELNLLITELKRSYKDIPIYATGDLVDRGPDSMGVIQTLIDNRIQSVIGNHDEWVRSLLMKDIVDDWVLSEIMGGAATFKSYLNKDALSKLNSKSYQVVEELFASLFLYMPQSHKEYFINMPLVKEVSLNNMNIYISHGGIDKDYFNITEWNTTNNMYERNTLSNTYETLELMLADREHQSKLQESILWGRPQFQKRNHTVAQIGVNSFQVFGHTPVPEPVITDTFAAIDTGSCFKDLGYLSAIVLPDKKIFKIQNKF